MRNCPTCGKSVEYGDNPWRPFCSERCKLIEFDKWTSEEYCVPGISVNAGETVSDSQRSDASVSDKYEEKGLIMLRTLKPPPALMIAIGILLVASVFMTCTRRPLPASALGGWVQDNTQR